MKVRDLVAILSKFNPEAEVVLMEGAVTQAVVVTAPKWTGDDQTPKVRLS